MSRKKLIIYLILALIIASVWLFLRSRQKLTALTFVSSIPKNNSLFVSTKSEVVITFNRNITEEEKNILKVKLNPEEKIKTVYQENKIILSPETEFKTNTKYEIQVILKEKVIYTLVFTTFPLTPQEIEEQGTKQTAADLAFDEKYRDFLTNYPWYQTLPIERNEYRIIYDFERESFRIRIKIATETAEDEEVIVNKALEELRKIGVPDPIPYYTVK